ncbi:MAG: CotH kinase family protein [Clostridia bacterium]|nr:CotH kinase family protein [Clostridia bacterium]
MKRFINRIIAIFLILCLILNVCINIVYAIEETEDISTEEESRNEEKSNENEQLEETTEGNQVKENKEDNNQTDINNNESNIELEAENNDITSELDSDENKNEQEAQIDELNNKSEQEDELTEQEEGEIEEFSISVNIDNNAIKPFIKDDIYYLFMPKTANLQKLEIDYTGNIDSISGASIDNTTKKITGSFENNSELTINLKDGKVQKVIIMQSEVPSIYINNLTIKDDESNTPKTIQDVNSGNKSTKYNASLKVSGCDNNKNNITQEIELKGRGNSSWKMPKRSYQIKLNNKENLLGIGKSKEKKWILIANFQDPTLLKNKVINDLCVNSGLSTCPNSSFADLYVDGEYLGNYLVSDKIEIKDNRISLKDDKGVIIEKDNAYYYEEDYYFRSNRGDYYTVKEAFADGDEAATIEAMNSFKNSLNEFEKELYSSNPSWEKISSMIDVESFAKYYLINEFAENTDSYFSSCFYYKDGDNDVIHMGPTWDYDAAFGYSKGIDKGESPTIDYTLNYKNQSHMAYLYNFPQFAKIVDNIYSNNIKALLENTNINEMSKQIQNSAKMNAIVWSDENTYLNLVNKLSTFIENRKSYFNKRYFNKNIEYSSHIQGIGWTNSVNSGISGTSGKSLRLEGLKVSTCIEGASISYQSHVQNIGWQEWKKDGDLTGTIGQGLRIEAIRLKLNNAPKYSIRYRVHVENIGWTDWIYDGQIAGTTGKSLRIEAIEIQIIDRTPKTKLYIDTPNNIVTNSPRQAKITGWKMSNLEGTKIKVYIDDNTVELDPKYIKYKKREDVIARITGYGTAEQNALPGFDVSIPTEELEIGKHSAKIVVCLNDEELKNQTVLFDVTRNTVPEYQTHIQNIGWQEWKRDGQIAGTSGQSLRLEAIKIELDNMPNVDAKYQVHIQNIGWQEWKKNGELAGTEGKSLRLEAIRIKLDYSNEYTIMYRVHVQNVGWQAWKEEGELAGTEGKSLRLEAIQIKVVKKTPKTKIYIDTPQNTVTNSPRQVKITGWKMSNLTGTKLHVYIDDSTIPIEESYIKYKKREDVLAAITGYGTVEQNALPGFDINIPTENLEVGKHSVKIVVSLDNKEQANQVLYFEVTRNVSVEYSTHMQYIGWQEYVDNGETSGAIGSGYRLEALKINLYNNFDIEGDIKYSAYVQNIGWQEEVENNELSGTTNQEKKIEAIKVSLTGELAEKYNIYYRTYVQEYGWLGWASNGENAGVQGDTYRIEAIQIMLTAKETTVDTSGKAFVIKPALTYQTHVQGKGWQQYVKEGNVSGTIGESLRLEALRLNIQDTNLTGTIECSAHVQNIGWKSFVEVGKIAGTEGQSLRLEAIRIRLTEELEENFDIYYRTHVQNMGWIAWAKNGESAGTQGYSFRLEAIQIKLVPKGCKAPGGTTGHFYNKALERKSIEGVKTILGKVCAGIDVSYYQGSINWADVKNKTDFVIVRCGYGKDVASQDDPKFEEYMEGCIKYNIPIEVYLYSYADSTDRAFSEASHVVRLCEKYKKYVKKVWYDVEDGSVFNQISSGNMSKEDLGRIVDTFANRVKSAGYDVGLYTYSYAINNYFTAETKNKYDIWIANYPGNSQDVFEAKYNLYRTLYKMWQFTSEGIIDGINGGVDMSIRF